MTVHKLLVALALSCATVLIASPAHAHSGARAQLFISGFRLEPAGDTWIAKAKLIDYDSGAAAPGYNVTLTGTSASGQRLGPVALTDEAAVGQYSAKITAAAGSWTFAVHAEEIPGGEQGVPVTKAFSVTLAPGQNGVGLASKGESRGSRREFPVVGMALGLTGAVVIGFGVWAALFRGGRVSRVAS